MIAVWSNGRDCSSAGLVFIDTGEEGIRVVTHCVGLIRLLDGWGNDTQAIVATAPDMTFSPALQSVSIGDWLKDVCSSAITLRDDASQKELDRVLAALPDWALAAASLWHVDGIGERIHHRRPRL